MGSRGRGGFAGLLLGSVSRQCVHRSLCPVVVVRPTSTSTNPASTDAAPAGSDERVHTEGGAHRIVVGVDGSPSSNAALRWAAEEAELIVAELELFHTWQWLASAGWAYIPSDFDPRHDAGTVLAGSVEPVRSLHPDLAISAVTAEGQAADVLVRASEGADLLAVGNRGHGELTGMLLGSVSEYCVAHAHCPVLVMHGASADSPSVD